MIFTLDAQVLKETFGIGSKYVGKSTLPALEFASLTVGPEHLAIRSTDLAKSIDIRTAVLKTYSEFEPGTPGADLQVLVPAKKFAEVLSVWNDRRILLELNKRTQTLRLTGSRTDISLRCMDVAEYPPKMGTFGGGAHCHFTADAATLWGGLKTVIACASVDDARPALSGVSIEVNTESGAIDLQAADGFRCAVNRVHLPAGAVVISTTNGNTTKFTAIVPARVLDDAMKLFPRGDVSVSLHRGSSDGIRTIAITSAAGANPEIEIAGLLVDGNFPDVSQIIPKINGDTLLELDPALLRQALRQTLVFSVTKMAVLTFAEYNVEEKLGFIRVSGHSEESGNVDEMVPFAAIDMPGDVKNWKTGINANLLASLLQYDSKTRIFQKDATSPILVTYDDNSYYKGIVMPMHVSG